MCFVLKVVSYSLIMWDSVEPTQHWIDSIIPEVTITTVQAMFPNYTYHPCRHCELAILLFNHLVSCICLGNDTCTFLQNLLYIE